MCSIVDLIQRHFHKAGLQNTLSCKKRPQGSPVNEPLPYHRKNWMQCCCLVTKSCLTLSRPHGLQPTRLLCPQNSPGKNTGVGCCLLFQGIFLTQGLNPSLLQWQSDSLPLCHQKSPNAVSHLVKLETTATFLSMDVSYAHTGSQKASGPSFVAPGITA